MSIYTSLKEIMQKDEKKWLRKHGGSRPKLNPEAYNAEWAMALHRVSGTRIEVLYGIPSPITTAYIRKLVEYGFSTDHGRKIVAATLEDNYGEVNTVLFSVAGSPPKGRILMNVSDSRDDDDYYQVDSICLLSNRFDDSLVIDLLATPTHISKALCKNGIPSIKR